MTDMQKTVAFWLVLIVGGWALLNGMAAFNRWHDGDGYNAPVDDPDEVARDFDPYTYTP